MSLVAFLNCFFLIGVSGGAVIPRRFAHSAVKGMAGDTIFGYRCALILLGHNLKSCECFRVNCWVCEAFTWCVVSLVAFLTCFFLIGVGGGAVIPRRFTHSAV